MPRIDRKSQPSVWLRDSLTAMRTEFYRYPNASTKYRFSNRCRTAVYHRDGKKYYLIADVYDSTGTKWWNQEKWTDADSTKKIVHNATGRYYLINRPRVGYWRIQAGAAGVHAGVSRATAAAAALAVPA